MYKNCFVLWLWFRVFVIWSAVSMYSYGQSIYLVARFYPSRNGWMRFLLQYPQVLMVNSTQRQMIVWRHCRGPSLISNNFCNLMYRFDLICLYNLSCWIFLESLLTHSSLMLGLGIPPWIPLCRSEWPCWCMEWDTPSSSPCPSRARAHTWWRSSHPASTNFGW